MSLSVGIVGLPNVGKSTLFNALLKQQAALAANYPFATIEPNVGVVPVPDERLEELAVVIAAQTPGAQQQVSQNTPGSQPAPLSKRGLPPIKPATVEFVDIAGLVKGASAGEGLGNQFLSHIREVDVIAQVIRDFSDTQVLREGSVDVQSDLETIQMELLLADLSTLEKQKEPKATKDKQLLDRWEVIQTFLSTAREGTQLRDALGSPEASQIAKELNLLTTKPILYVLNIDEERLRESDTLAREYAVMLGCSQTQVVVVSAQIESELSSLSDSDQALYLKDLGLAQSGLERLITTAYETLKLQSFLTAGEKEVRAWTIRQGTTAPQAAGVIHTDFEKKFIKAKVSSYADFVAHNGWKGVKESGQLRLEGREYVMQEGDVVEFMVGS